MCLRSLGEEYTCRVGTDVSRDAGQRVDMAAHVNVDTDLGRGGFQFHGNFLQDSRQGAGHLSLHAWFGQSTTRTCSDAGIACQPGNVATRNNRLVGDLGHLQRFSAGEI